MSGNILDSKSNPLEDPSRTRVRRIELTEQMREFGQADSRMIGYPGSKQILDAVGRASLQYVNIDAGIEQQLSSC